MPKYANYNHGKIGLADKKQQAVWHLGRRHSRHGVGFPGFCTSRKLSYARFRNLLFIVNTDLCLRGRQTPATASGSLFGFFQFGYRSACTLQRFAAFDVSIFAESAAHEAIPLPPVVPESGG